MDELVLDANVFFSAFISKNDKYTDAFKDREIYVPDFVFIEIEKYKHIILKKSKIPDKNLQGYVINLMKCVTVVPNFLISPESFRKAHFLCQNIDEKDTAYVALSIELDIYLLSSDKILVKGLRKKGFKNIVLLEEFFKKFYRKKS